MACVCECERRTHHGLSTAIVLADVCVTSVTQLDRYVRQDKSCRGHQCRRPDPKSSTFRQPAKFFPCRELNSSHHDQELGALTKELANQLRLYRYGKLLHLLKRMEIVTMARDGKKKASPKCTLSTVPADGSWGRRVVEYWMRPQSTYI